MDECDRGGVLLLTASPEKGRALTDTLPFGEETRLVSLPGAPRSGKGFPMGYTRGRAAFAMAGICLLIAACGGGTDRVASTTSLASPTPDSPQPETQSHVTPRPGNRASAHPTRKSPSVTRAAHSATATRTYTTTGTHATAGTPGTTGTHTTGSPRPAASSTRAGTAVHAARKLQIDLTEVTHVTFHQAAVFVESGSASGPPIGSGTTLLRARLTAGGVLVTSFTVSASAGSITGQAQTTAHLGTGSVSYLGTAQLISGTGNYRDVRGSHIRVTGTGNLRGRTILHLTGSAYN